MAIYHINNQICKYCRAPVDNTFSWESDFENFLIMICSCACVLFTWLLLLSWSACFVEVSGCSAVL